MLPCLAVPLQHFVNRAEIGFDLLGLASAQVALGKPQQSRLLERLEYLFLLLAQLVQQPVHLRRGRQLPRLPSGLPVALARDHGNSCVTWRMTVVSGRFMSAARGGAGWFR